MQQKVAQFDEVVAGMLMTGSQDFLLEVVVGSSRITRISFKASC